jgi:hypothetical protein
VQAAEGQAEKDREAGEGAEKCRFEESQDSDLTG